MTLNSIGGLYIFNPFRHNDIMGDKFGYRFAIRTERGVYDELESIGSLGWDGAFYCNIYESGKFKLLVNQYLSLG